MAREQSSSRTRTPSDETLVTRLRKRFEQRQELDTEIKDLIEEVLTRTQKRDEEMRSERGEREHAGRGERAERSERRPARAGNGHR